MANTAYANGGFSLSTVTSTFRNWLNITNQILAELGSTIVTTSANSTGATTVGNAYVQGIMSADNLVAGNGLRGGTTTTSNTLNVTSSLNVANTLVVTGNTTMNVANVVTINSTTVTSNTVNANVVNANTVTANVAAVTVTSNTITANLFNGAQAANLASNGTINLDNLAGNYVNLTGNTSVSVIVLNQGHDRWVQFTNNIPLVYSANLVIPGGLNFTTAPGDVANFVGEGNGVVRIRTYLPANTIPGQLPSSVNLTLVTANNVNANQVSSNNVVANTFTSSNLTSNNIAANNITANTVTANVNSINISANSVTANVFQETQAPNLATAATLNLEGISGNYVWLTGNTGITAITLNQGHEREVYFSNTVVLTNSGTLVCLGNSSITTQPGDIARFRGESGGVVRMTAYWNGAVLPTILGSAEKYMNTGNTVLANSMFILDSSGGSFAINISSTPIGSWAHFSDPTGSWSGNNVTINLPANANNVGTLSNYTAGPLVLNMGGETFMMVLKSVNSANVWILS